MFSGFNPCSGGSIALGRGYAVERDAPASVSILVLVEVLPWAEGLLSGGEMKILFQSLFWWKYCPGLDRSGCWRRLPRTGFNPCSGGSIALGPPQPCAWTPRAQVSILVLVEVLPWVDRADGGWWEVMFQSLFWWKYCPGFNYASPFRSVVQSFNPCSGGSIALGGFHGGWDIES